MDLYTQLKQNAASGDSCQGVSEDMNNAADLIDALLGVLECFGDYEGTWFQGHWNEYGITKDMENRISIEYDARKIRSGRPDDEYDD